MKKYSFETNKQRSVVYKLQTRNWHCFTANFTKCRAGSGDGVLAVCFYAFRVCNTNRTLRNERCGESERKFPNEAGASRIRKFSRDTKDEWNLPKSQTYSFVLQTKPTESKPAGPWPASPPGSRSCGNSTRSFSGWKGAPTGRCELAIKNLQNSCFCTLSKIFKTHLLACSLSFCWYDNRRAGPDQF